MTPVYKTTDDLLSDYNSLPEIEQNRVGKYLKNLVRIHKAIASLNFADRQVNWELSKQRIEPYWDDPTALKIRNRLNCAISGKMQDTCERPPEASYVPDYLMQGLSRTPLIGAHWISITSTLHNQLVAHIIYLLCLGSTRLFYKAGTK